jgi:hypothetical protein
VHRPAVDAHLATHHGVIHYGRAIELGVSRSQIDTLVCSGRWVRVYKGVFRLAGAPDGPEARTLAACLAGGRDAAASHLSALWLWGLTDHPPRRPTVSVPGARRATVAGVAVRRRADLQPQRIRQRWRIPVTDPLRSLCDVGEVVAAKVLDDAIDRGLARRLTTVLGLEAEVARRARRGRTGVPALREALHRRGMSGAPDPSVLESRTLRVLARAGIVPLGTEVKVLDGAYRLDFLLRPRLALEVDGFAYHASPEAKSVDSRRRNRLRLAGFHVIEADWLEVTRHPERLQAAVHEALAAKPS